MSISVLSQGSDVSVTAIKYYAREGLTRSTLDSKADDVETVNQLRLIRGLVRVVGLSIRQVRRILDLVRDPELSPAALMASVTADLSLTGARVVDDTDLAGARTTLASIGFDEPPNAPYVNQLLIAIASAEENGVGMGVGHLAAYTTAARKYAKSGFNHMLFDPLSREVQIAVLDTLICDSIPIELRRLAHRELVDQLTPFQSQQKNEKEMLDMQNMIPEVDTVPVTQCLRFDPPEVLCITETSAPVAEPHDLMMNVAAINVDRVGTDVRVGRDKFLTGHRLPQFAGLGFSREVVGIGPQVHDFDIGQCVWGFLGTDQPGKHGTATGRIAVDADLVAPAPASLDLAELATPPLIGVTAWQALEELGVGSDSWLLIVKGAGGVGSVTVQVARARDAFVDTINSVRHDELPRQLGAESHFDPEPAAWSTLTGRYQMVLGTTGNNLWQLHRLVAPSSRLFMISPAGTPMSFLTKILPGPTIVLMSVQPGRTGLVALTDLVEAGQLNPIIRVRFPFAEISRARALVEAGHDGGKVTIDIS